jgi:hypothetical protein
MLRRFGVVLMGILVALALAGCGQDDLPDNSRLESAFTDGRTGIWVSGHGTVIRPLGSDATSQRFLLRISDDLSIVLRHQIGQSGPIPAERGDVIAFQGRYEFHGGGGEVILTHADAAQPGGGGWVTHQGTRYE